MIEYTNEDCMIGMARYPDKYFDLAIVDPPYGLDRYKKNDGGNSKKIRCFGDNDKNWNNEKPDTEYYQELFRVSKNQIIWGANNFELPTSEYFIIWDKQQMMPSFARCEMAWTNCKVPAKYTLAEVKTATASIPRKNQLPFINGYSRTTPNKVT